MTTSLVSVIIPTFNRGDLICRAVDSALQQTYPNLQVIVVDDGSTDRTLHRLRRYGSQIQVISQANAGPSAARNRGIQAAKGELIAFLDSDDLWLPAKIERQVALLQKAGAHVPGCVCNAVLKYTDRPQITSFQNSLLQPPVAEGLWLNTAQVLLRRFLLFNQTAMVRREVLERIGGFDESLRYLEDYDLALRVSLLGPLAYTSELLVIYNAGTAGSLAEEARQKDICIRENMVRIRQRLSDKVSANNAYAGLDADARRSLRLAQRALWVSRLRQKQVPGAVLMSRILDRLGRYWSAAADRSPWFEGMKAVPLPQHPSQQQSSDITEQGAVAVVGVDHRV